VADKFGRWAASFVSGRVHSDLRIARVGAADEELQQLCVAFGVQSVACALRVSWRGTSDWDGFAGVTEGSTIVALVKAPGNARYGRLLRSQGYAEAVPAEGRWEMCDDGSFLTTT